MKDVEKSIKQTIERRLQQDWHSNPLTNTDKLLKECLALIDENCIAPNLLEIMIFSLAKNIQRLEETVNNLKKDRRYYLKKRAV